MRYKRDFKNKYQTGGPSDDPARGVFGEGRISTKNRPDYGYLGNYIRDAFSGDISEWAGNELLEGPTNLVRNLLGPGAEGIAHMGTFIPRNIINVADSIYRGYTHGSAPTKPSTSITSPEDVINPPTFDFSIPSTSGTPISQESGSSTSKPNSPESYSVPGADLGDPQMLSSPTKASITPTEESIANREVSAPESIEGEDSGGGDFLQFIPEMMNFATGMIGKDRTLPPTRMSDRAVKDMPSRFNINPQLQQSRKAYRAILADPNATNTQKLAAQAQLNSQESRLMAEKQNREAQMQANRAQVQADVDRTNAGFRRQHRDDRMRSRANLGPTGNFARQAVTSASQKLLQQQAMESQEKKTNKELLAFLGSFDDATRKKILENFDLLDGQ